MTLLEWLGVVFLLQIAGVALGGALIRWHARRRRDQLSEGVYYS